MILVIPMAGDGSRFLNDGYTTIKPLIEFQGKTMVEHVIGPFLNLDKITKVIAIIRQDHVDDFQLDKKLKAMSDKIKYVTIGEKTEGAACTILCAKDLINTNEELAIINCDNIIEFDNLDIPKDGKIFTFEEHEKSIKWSYAKLDSDGHVTEVQEKQPISTHATAGLYLWKRGRDFVTAAEQMIGKDIRFNNEFYLAPVYNENVVDGQHIEIANTKSVNIVGTPEDLDNYLAKFA